jgi:hypothetical protein
MDNEQSEFPIERVTIRDACKIIGGTKPINRSTYWRGVKAKRYPAPDRVAPGVSRIDLRKLRAAIDALVSP